MKQLSQQVSKILLILVLLISTGYTGILSSIGLDLSEPANANSQVWNYTFKVTYSGADEQYRYNPRGYKTGENLTFTVDFSNNKMTLGKGNWTFGDTEGSTANPESVSRMFDIWSAQNSSGFSSGSKLTGNSYRWDTQYFTGSTVYLNSTGAQVLNSLSVNSSVVISQVWDYYQDGVIYNSGVGKGYMTLTSKSQSSGGSCGGPT